MPSIAWSPEISSGHVSLQFSLHSFADWISREGRIFGNCSACLAKCSEIGGHRGHGGFGRFEGNQFW